MSELRAAERRVTSVIESSAVFGVLDRAIGCVWRAARVSAVAAAAAQIVTVWRSLDTPLRRFAAGTMLVAAVAAHILLILATQVPPGWIWLILPGVYAAVGLLLIAASGFPGVFRR